MDLARRQQRLGQVPDGAVPAAYWSIPIPELLSVLGSSSNGLSAAEAERRLRSGGANTLDDCGPATAPGVLANQFRSPLLLILVFAAVISTTPHEWIDAAVVLTIILSSALLSFVQEYRASSAVEKLRHPITPTTTVLRAGRAATVPTRDVVLLAAGSLVPADRVILNSNCCFVNQAVLTGESLPIEKDAAPRPADAGLAEHTSCVFMGASALVLPPLAARQPL